MKTHIETDNIKIEFLGVTGIDQMLLGLYLPYDSNYSGDIKCNNCDYYEQIHGVAFYDRDINLIRKLYRNGDDHAKVLRFVQIYFDITAPRYWWQEFDTYRIGIEKISSSTMHDLVPKIKKTLKENSSFSWLSELFNIYSLDALINITEMWKDMYKLEQSSNVTYDWYRIIKSSLPEGLKQRRIVMISLQTALRMIKQRHNHRLNEWKIFCNFLSDIGIIKLILNKNEKS